jgi:hypothetical protein
MQANKMPRCAACALILIFFCLYSEILRAQISILPQTSYHKASYGSTYGVQEAGTADNGGLICMFVRNTGGLADSISEVRVSRNGVQANGFFSQCWPLEILPGETAAIRLKGIASPFAQGDTILIELISRAGFSAQEVFINKTPGLRIANYMPEHDLSAMYLYLRNDQTTDISLLHVSINDTTLSVGDPALTVLGSALVKPAQIAIVKIQSSALSWSPLMPLRMSVGFSSGGNTDHVSAFERLVPADFPIGSWHSPIANGSEEEGRKRLRSLSIGPVFGPNNVSDMTSNLPEYYMQVVREPDFSNNGNFDPAQGGQFVAQNSSNPVFYYWLVDDEPDLNNKPISEELQKNLAFWQNDSNTPSYVNLASQKNYQRYGFFTDVICMDHYSDDGPPCVIPFPYWYTTEGSVREALEYTAQLKKNTEPKRMNSWSQLISTAFSNQTEPHVVNFQFWAHVGCGAKGMFFFTAKPAHQDDEPALWNESRDLTRQLNGIKNICLYSEPWEGVTVNSGNVIAKALAGPNTLSIILLNNSIDFTSVNLINREWVSTVQPVQYSIQFTVPDWIPLEQFYETTAEGRNGIQSISLISGRTYRISGTIGARSQVFVIGKNDTQAPETITEINVSDRQSPSSFTLSWKEPLDDFGVKGYLIKADNDIIDTARAPIWNAANRVNGCERAYWSVIPFDDAGNTGQPAVLSIDWSNFGGGTPDIFVQASDQSVMAGDTAYFSIADSGAAYPVYSWQVDTGDGQWNSLTNGVYFSGVHTSELSVYGLPSFSGYRFRCIVGAGCSGLNDSSAVAALEVNGTLSVGQQLSPGQLEVFPSPASDMLQLIAPEENIIVEIFDHSGRCLLKENSQERKMSIALQAFSAGLYRIRVMSRSAKLWQTAFMIAR